MAERAQVKSVDAIEGFRSQLVVYLSQARPALEEVSAEIVRVRTWLENDQRMYWEGQIRRRTRALEQAQQALFSGRLSNLKHETSAEQLAYHRARRALEEAEEKLRTVKRWNREFDSRVQPLLKQVEKLHTILSNDMAKALASLSQTIMTLAAYADIKVAPVEGGMPSSAGASPAAPAPTDKTGSGGA
jgi:hypothetical protein